MARRLGGSGGRTPMFEESGTDVERAEIRMRRHSTFELRLGA